MMYVEMTKDLEVNLMGMSLEEAVALLRMIEGAGLQERRIFNGVLQQLKHTCGQTDEINRLQHEYRRKSNCQCCRHR